jgi:hypothetical protein
VTGAVCDVPQGSDEKGVTAMVTFIRWFNRNWQDDNGDGRVVAASCAVLAGLLALLTVGVAVVM